MEESWGKVGEKFGGKFGGKLEESLCRNGTQVCMISKVSSEKSLEESWGKVGGKFGGKFELCREINYLWCHIYPKIYRLAAPVLPAPAPISI